MCTWIISELTKNWEGFPQTSQSHKTLQDIVPKLYVEKELNRNGIRNYSSFVNCLIFSNFAERRKTSKYKRYEL